MNIPVSPDANVYLVALLLAIVSGLLFGIVPVRQVFKSNPYEIVKAGSSARIGQRLSVRDLLLLLQIAICAVLVTSSLVAVRGLARSLHANFGFEPQDTLLVDTNLAMSGYLPDKMAAMQRQMMDATRAIPGVNSVGLVDTPPLHLGWNISYVFSDHATDLRTPSALAQAIEYRISPEYLQAAKTALVAGRNFNWHDDENAPPVAVINREFARKFFANRSEAIGERFKMPDGRLVLVVGIA